MEKLETTLKKLIDRELASLGYARQKGPRFGRSIPQFKLKESFYFLETGSPRTGVRGALLYAAISFSELPPPRHYEVKKMPDMHWEGQIDWVAPVRAEWELRGSIDNARDLRAAVQAASARFVSHAGNFRLMVAAGLGESGYDSLVELLKTPQDVNDGGQSITTPLIEAAARDYLPGVKALIAAGADPFLKRGAFTAAAAADYMADYFHSGESEVGKYLRKLKTRRK